MSVDFISDNMTSEHSGKATLTAENCVSLKFNFCFNSSSFPVSVTSLNFRPLMIRARSSKVIAFVNSVCAASFSEDSYVFFEMFFSSLLGIFSILLNVFNNLFFISSQFQQPFGHRFIQFFFPHPVLFQEA